MEWCLESFQSVRECLWGWFAVAICLRLIFLFKKYLTHCTPAANEVLRARVLEYIDDSLCHQIIALHFFHQFADVNMRRVQNLSIDCSVLVKQYTEDLTFSQIKLLLSNVCSRKFAYSDVVQRKLGSCYHVDPWKRSVVRFGETRDVLVEEFLGRVANKTSNVDCFWFLRGFSLGIQSTVDDTGSKKNENQSKKQHDDNWSKKYRNEASLF